MSVRASICLVALANLRTAAHATVRALADESDPQLGRLRDRLSVDLTASHPIYLVDANPEDTARELARLHEIASEVATAFRHRHFDDGTLRVLRSFEDAVNVAHRVVSTEQAAWPSSGVHRAVPRPLDVARRNVG